jgi:hypothetical protein
VRGLGNRSTCLRWRQHTRSQFSSPRGPGFDLDARTWRRISRRVCTVDLITSGRPGRIFDIHHQCRYLADFFSSRVPPRRGDRLELLKALAGLFFNPLHGFATLRIRTHLSCGEQVITCSDRWRQGRGGPRHGSRCHNCSIRCPFSACTGAVAALFSPWNRSTNRRTLTYSKSHCNGLMRPGEP